MSSFLTALSSQHEKEADRERQTSRIRICVDRWMDSNTPVEKLKQRGIIAETEKTATERLTT